MNADDKGICEIFTNTTGEACAVYSETVARLISMALRADISKEYLLKQLSKVQKCPGCIHHEDTYVKSCVDAIRIAIETALKELGLKNDVRTFSPKIFIPPRGSQPCPVDGCTGYMIFQEGCNHCVVCGYSNCE